MTQNPNERPEIIGLPHVDEDTLDVIPVHDNTYAQTGIWDQLGDSQTELVRRGLVRAHELREQGVAVEDAFLDGMRFVYYSLKAQIDLNKFREAQRNIEISDVVDEHAEAQVASVTNLRTLRVVPDDETEDPSNLDQDNVIDLPVENHEQTKDRKGIWPFRRRRLGIGAASVGAAFYTLSLFQKPKHPNGDDAA